MRSACWLRRPNADRGIQWQAGRLPPGLSTLSNHRWRACSDRPDDPFKPWQGYHRSKALTMFESGSEKSNYVGAVSGGDAGATEDITSSSPSAASLFGASSNQGTKSGKKSTTPSSFLGWTDPNWVNAGNSYVPNATQRGYNTLLGQA